MKKLEEIKLYLKKVLSEEHYVLIQNVTDNSREKEFLKKKQLMDKYNSLLETCFQYSNNKTSLIKPAILKLTNEEIQKHYEPLLNLGPKVVPTSKNLLFMDTITSIKSSALDMEHSHKGNEAENLKQNVTIY